MVPDGDRVQPLVAHGCPELPSTPVLLLQSSIPTEAVVGAAHKAWRSQQQLAIL